MSRKTTPRSALSPSSASSKTAPKAGPKVDVAATKSSKNAVVQKVEIKLGSAAVKPAVAETKPVPVTAKPVMVETKPAPAPVSGRVNGSANGTQPAGQAARKPSNGQEATSQLLTRAEQDITTAIESLNNQMNAALTALAGLASAQVERGKAVVRTAPLDRATATFQRLVAEVVDDQLAEMLPPLIALRNEAGQWAAGSQIGSPEADFYRRNVETLDHVLNLAGVTSFDARPGQTFDPLIHLAVGESRRDDLTDGAVAECIQQGFRSGRGKVLSPARVRINRR
jgi:hypothetical protein